MTSSKSRQAGFTILELTIATAVFSVILLIIAAGIITFSRSYTRGLNQTRTQETARSVMSEVSQGIQLGKGLSTGAGGGWQAYCVDNVKYSYVLNQRFQSNESIHALVRSEGADQTCTPKTTFDANDKELLGNNMQLREFSISSNSPHNVRVTILYGDGPDLFIGNNCKPGPGSEYCAAATLQTTVVPRL